MIPFVGLNERGYDSIIVCGPKVLWWPSICFRLVFPEIELEPSNVMASSNSTDLSTSRIVYGQSVPEPWMDFPVKCIRRSG